VPHYRRKYHLFLKEFEWVRWLSVGGRSGAIQSGEILRAAWFKSAERSHHRIWNIPSICGTAPLQKIDSLCMLTFSSVSTNTDFATHASFHPPPPLTQTSLTCSIPSFSVLDVLRPDVRHPDVRHPDAHRPKLLRPLACCPERLFTPIPTPPLVSNPLPPELAPAP
jgi:hypothetical protein